MPKRILTPKEMYLCDAAAIAGLEREHPGEGSRMLMGWAAEACCAHVCELLSGRAADAHPCRVLILCGTGNNGGDGYALAVLLSEQGFQPEIRMTGEVSQMSPECRYRYEEAAARGIPMYRDEAWRDKHYVYDCIVDALLGIGLSKPVGGELACVIDAVNAYLYPFDDFPALAPLLAIDIPSGVDALTGEVRGTAIRATDTETISYHKRGMLLYPGTTYCGSIVCAKIGIDDAVLAEHPEHIPVYAPDEDDLSRLPARAPDGNKGTFGRVVIFAGSRNMCGAAYLSGLAAYRMGAGLVELMTVEDNRIPLQTLLPEAVMTTYTGIPEADGICTVLARADAVVLGPGLGTSAGAAHLVETVLKHTTVPTVIDADALNLIAADACLSALLDRCAARVPVICTPHPGELSRLTGMSVAALKASFFDTAADYAKKHGIVLCAKDARTVTTDGKAAYLNTSGCSAMAKGGSGDVLTGILAALLAQNRNADVPMTALEAAALGVYIHGLAGEKAAERCGMYGVLARDIADSICAAAVPPTE